MLAPTQDCIPPRFEQKPLLLLSHSGSSVEGDVASASALLHAEIHAVILVPNQLLVAVGEDRGERLQDNCLDENSSLISRPLSTQLPIS